MLPASRIALTLRTPYSDPKIARTIRVSPPRPPMPRLLLELRSPMTLVLGDFELVEQLVKG
jgi:hypothetical protein